MKIETAKNKICPLSFATPTGCCCLAADCMAWRWFNTDSGFCGLAGKPENSAGSGITRKSDPTQEMITSVKAFVETCCVRKNENHLTPASEIFDRYFQLGFASMSQKIFGSIFSTYFESVKRGGKMYYQGIVLK